MRREIKILLLDFNKVTQLGEMAQKGAALGVLFDPLASTDMPITDPTGVEIGRVTHIEEVDRKFYASGYIDGPSNTINDLFAPKPSPSATSISHVG